MAQKHTLSVHTLVSDILLRMYSNSNKRDWQSGDRCIHLLTSICPLFSQPNNAQQPFRWSRSLLNYKTGKSESTFFCFDFFLSSHLDFVYRMRSSCVQSWNRLNPCSKFHSIYIYFCRFAGKLFIYFLKLRCQKKIITATSALSSWSNSVSSFSRQSKCHFITRRRSIVSITLVELSDELCGS